MKKLKAISILMSFCIAASITGCGASDGGDQNSGTQAGGSGEPVPVKLAVWGSGAADNFTNGAEEFNSRQDEIDFTVEMQSGDYNQFLGAKTAANDLPDMFFLTPYE